MQSLNIKKYISSLQDFYWLSVQILINVFKRPFYFKDTIEQMEYAGFGSLIIVFLVCLFIGMALALQLSAELATLGLKMYTGRVVGMSVIREIGPVIVALVFAGRVGTGITSELGSMVLGQQVDSLRAFGVDPIKKLITPRVIAALAMLPLLTIIGDAVAILGAYYISVFASNQSSYVYWTSIKGVMNFENLFAGFVKPFIFGYLISSICCYVGITTRGGAKGLRNSVTNGVVISIISIIISDFMLTRIMFYILGFSL